MAKISDPTRRKFLVTSGGVGLASLAGCISGDDEEEDLPDDFNEDDGSQNVQDDGMEDEVAYTWPTQNQAPQIHYNPLNPNSSEGHPYDILAYFNTLESEWEPNIISDWSVDGDTLRLTVDEEFVWHDGSEVNGEDLAVFFKIQEAFGHSMHDLIEDWEPDGKSIDVTLVSEDTNPGVVIDTILNNELFAYRDVYGEYRDRLEAIDEGDSDEELEDVQQELLDLEIDDPVGNSPYKFRELADEDRILFDIFEDYPWADEINYDAWEVVVSIGDQQRWLDLTEGELDGHGGFGISADQVQARPDFLDVFNPQENAMVGHFFDLDDEWFGKREVRLALAHILDFETLAELANAGTLSHFTGITIEGIAESYLGDRIDDLTYYGTVTGEDEERAEQLLEEAGLERQDGTWMKPDGSPFEISFEGISGWNVAVIQGELMVDSLQAFGIEAEMSTHEFATFISQEWEQGSDGVVHMHTGPSGYHPWFHYRDAFDPDGEWDQWNMKAEVEIPMPIGDPEGSLETVNVKEKLDELGTTTDADREEELVLELAWAYNQSLPYLITTPYDFPQFLRSDGWDYPAAGAHPDPLQEHEDMYLRAGIHDYIKKRGIVKHDPEE